METPSSQLHKSSIRSANVLNLRDAKTARQQWIEKERKKLLHTRTEKNGHASVKNHETSNYSKAQTNRQSRERIPSAYQSHFTLSVTPLKALSLFMVMVLNATMVLVVGPTLSYFADSEESTLNAFGSGSVDFVLQTTPFAGVATATPEGDVEAWDVDVIPEDASNPFYYFASSTNFHGSLELCEVISVVATLDGVVMYEGPLMDLVSATTTSIDEWTFEFSGAVGFPGEMCHFDIDFNGWQTRHGLLEGGYSDTETVSYWILDPGVIINKVRLGTDGWVELYNPSSIDVDVSTWQICDNNECDLLPYVDPIPVGGYGIIVGDESVLYDVIVPDDVVVIVLADGAIGDGLEPDADMLELITLRGFVADQLNWGDPDDLWPNYSDDLWMPGLSTTSTPDVFNRMPTGLDTNDPSDFVPLQVPEVDITDPNASSEWESGSTETIEWTALNPNGDDDELLIDIYWIDAGGDVHTIALDTENDGEHDWMVAAEEGESFRIKIVAKGPENILLQTIARSEMTVALCAENSTSTGCVGLILELEKKFSGEDLGFTADQFSFHVVGGDIDTIVPHGGSVRLPVGYYTITELVPDDFDVPDWRIQWSGDTCEGENIAGGLAWIDVEESDLRKVVTYCRADNQFRPETREREESSGGGGSSGSDEETEEDDSPDSDSNEEDEGGDDGQDEGDEDTDNQGGDDQDEDNQDGNDQGEDQDGDDGQGEGSEGDDDQGEGGEGDDDQGENEGDDGDGGGAPGTGEDVGDDQGEDEGGEGGGDQGGNDDTDTETGGGEQGGEDVGDDDGDTSEDGEDDSDDTETGGGSSGGGDIGDEGTGLDGADGEDGDDGSDGASSGGDAVIEEEIIEVEDS